MRSSPAHLVALLSLAVGCGQGDTCPEAVHDVERSTVVGGISAEGLFDWLGAADENIRFGWMDGTETRLHAELVVGRETGQAVNSPACIAECVEVPENIPVDACGPDWLTIHAAGVVWTDDGRLGGEAFVGRALAIDDQWRLDLVPARGAEFQGNLVPWEIVELPDDTVEWQLNATMIGGTDELLAAEVRLKTRQNLGDGESGTQTQRLGVTPGTSGGGS